MVWDLRRPEAPVFQVAVPDPAVAALSPDGRRVFTATDGERTPAGVRRRLRPPAAVDRPASAPTGVGSRPSARTGRHSPSAPGTGSCSSTPRPWPTQTRAPRLARQRRRRRATPTTARCCSRPPMAARSSGTPTPGPSCAGWRVKAPRSGMPGSRPTTGPCTWRPLRGPLMAWDLTGERPLVRRKGHHARRRVSWIFRFPRPTGARSREPPDNACGSWTARTGQETARSRTHRTVWFHAWSPDCQWFLTVGPGVLSLWDPDTGRRRRAQVRRRRRRGGHFQCRRRKIHVHDRFADLETLDRATLRPAVDSVAVGDVSALVPHPRTARSSG